MNTTTTTTSIVSISANQLRAGDVVEYGGRWYRVSSVVRPAGGSWPIAVDGKGWSIALGDSAVNVLSRRN